MRTMKKALHNVEAQQERVLFNILKINQSTEYGQKYGFNIMSCVEAFRERVPVVGYEDLRPYVLEQDRSGKPVLYQGNPIYYAMTSGTTGEPKYIPIHKSAIKAHKRSQDLFTFHLFMARPKILSGRMLTIVSPAVEGYMESGRPFGATSGFMYEDVPSIVRNLFIVPTSVFKIEDYDLKYLTILRLALQEENLTMITTANPSTITKLVTVMEKNIEWLADEIETGTFRHFHHLDKETQREVQPHLVPNPQRAHQIRTLVRSTGLPKIKDLWPNLQAVAMWTGGSSSIFLSQLAGQFAESTLIRDLGYLSSEFRGSIPIFSGTNAGLPNLMSCYYEFVEQDKWEQGEKQFLGLHELKNQAKYYVFITTDYGLYRYDMNDIVQVDGFHQSCPLLRFIQKGKGVTSITGEKLYENQVIAAVRRAEKDLGVQSNFFLMRCDPGSFCYTLLYEPTRESANKLIPLIHDFRERVEGALKELNIEYDTKCKSGRLQKMKLAVLSVGCYDDFRKFHVNKGQRDGQFKIVALLYDKDLKFDFKNHIQKAPSPLNLLPPCEGSAI